MGEAPNKFQYPYMKNKFLYPFLELMNLDTIYEKQISIVL